MKVRILCVDDNEPLLMTRKLLLSRLGYDVLAARPVPKPGACFARPPLTLRLSITACPTCLAMNCARGLEAQPGVRVILVSGAYPDHDCPCADQFLLKGQAPTVLLQAVASLTKRAA